MCHMFAHMQISRAIILAKPTFTDCDLFEIVVANSKETRLLNQATSAVLLDNFLRPVPIIFN